MESSCPELPADALAKGAALAMQQRHFLQRAALKYLEAQARAEDKAAEEQRRAEKLAAIYGPKS